MPLTLADFARLAPDDRTRAVVDIWREASPAMDALPWEQTKHGGLTVQGIRYANSPTPQWRKINEDFSESKGTVEPFSERVKDIGGMVDVDIQILRAKEALVSDPRAVQIAMFSKAIAYSFNDTLINGGPWRDPDEVIGLRYRVLNDLPSDMRIDAGGIEIHPAVATAADYHAFLYAVDTAIRRLNGAELILCNSETYLAFNAGLRTFGLLRTDQDSFGREVTTYKGAKIIDMGNNRPDAAGTQIIPNTFERDGDPGRPGTDTFTELYVVRVGKSEFLYGIYQYKMRVEDLGLIDDGVTYRTVIDWPVGIKHANPRSFARVFGFDAVSTS